MCRYTRSRRPFSRSLVFAGLAMQRVTTLKRSVLASFNVQNGESNFALDTSANLEF